jgi:hypothetical protein
MAVDVMEAANDGGNWAVRFPGSKMRKDGIGFSIFLVAYVDGCLGAGLQKSVQGECWNEDGAVAPKGDVGCCDRVSMFFLGSWIGIGVLAHLEKEVECNEDAVS